MLLLRQVFILFFLDLIDDVGNCLNLIETFFYHAPSVLTLAAELVRFEALGKVMRCCKVLIFLCPLSSIFVVIDVGVSLKLRCNLLLKNDIL